MQFCYKTVICNYFIELCLVSKITRAKSQDGRNSHFAQMLPEISHDLRSFRSFSDKRRTILCRCSDFLICVLTEEDSLVEIASIQDIFIIGIADRLTAEFNQSEYKRIHNINLHNHPPWKHLSNLFLCTSEKNLTKTKILLLTYFSQNMRAPRRP